MSYFCDDVDTALGGYHTSAYTGLGVFGNQVPATGTDGPSALYWCLSLPADANREVFAQLTRLPLLGSLSFEEDGSFVYIGQTDYAEFRLWVDGVAAGIVRVNLVVGGDAPVVESIGTYGREVHAPIGLGSVVGKITGRMRWRPFHVEPVIGDAPVDYAAIELAARMAVEEAERKRHLALVESFSSIAFDRWLATLTDEQRKSLTPDAIRQLLMTPPPASLAGPLPLLRSSTAAPAAPLPLIRSKGKR